jgi:hypothetical protein
MIVEAFELVHQEFECIRQELNDEYASLSSPLKLQDAA